MTASEIKSGSYLPPGTRVVDRDSGGTGSAPMVVIKHPGVSCQEWDVPGTGKTVADFNEEYDPKEPVVVVAYDSSLDKALDDWEKLDESSLNDQVAEANIKTYAYPLSRLSQYGATVPDNITTYFELICYQHARLIHLAAPNRNEALLWGKYRDLVEGKIEMATVTKENKYQVQENPGRCIYCGKECEITFDHVIPVAGGGGSSIDNQVPACSSCNSKKSAKDVIDWHKEMDKPIERIVFGKYLKMYQQELETEGKIHEPLPEEERDRWNGLELTRNISRRIYKRDR